MEIRYITPFSTERNKLGYPNIGGEYNKCIAELPDDCYIVLRDGDTMFLTSDWGEYISEIINQNKDCDMFTCMTNRLSLDSCTMPGMFNNPNINDHVTLALNLKRTYAEEIQPTDIVAGLFMCFHKSLWQKIGGFKEYSIIFDRQFSQDAIKYGFKLGKAMGLYIFHCYRWNEEKPQQSIKHLRKKKVSG